MSYLLIVKPKELHRKLKKDGVEISVTRGKGSHIRIFYQGRQTTAPFHGNTDIGLNLLKSICKQFGLDPDEIL